MRFGGSGDGERAGDGQRPFAQYDFLFLESFGCRIVRRLQWRDRR